MWTYQATVDRVVDADTIDMTVDLGFRLYSKQRLRLARVDAWEVRGEERPRGLEAKAAVEALLPKGGTVRITTSKAGKFGRWLAEVEVENEDGDWFNLNSWLLIQGHAELYGG